MSVETEKATTPCADADRPDADAAAVAEDWCRWAPLHDGSQPIMDSLLAEHGGEL